MTNNLKDLCFSLWKFCNLINVNLRKLHLICMLLRILCLCTFLEVWLYMRRLWAILIRLWIRLCCLGFCWRILILMRRFSSKSVSSLYRRKCSCTSNPNRKYIQCTKTCKQQHPQPIAEYPNPHNNSNKTHPPPIHPPTKNNPTNNPHNKPTKTSQCYKPNS